MVRTRKQKLESGESLSQDSSSAKRQREEDEENMDEDEDLVIPRRALRGRYKQAFVDLYEKMTDLVDASPLPYFKKMVKNPKDAMEAFILALAEIFYADEGIEDDRDENEIEASADERIQQELNDLQEDGGEFADEDETEDDTEAEKAVEELEDHSSDVLMASEGEDEEEFDDEDVVAGLESEEDQ